MTADTAHVDSATPSMAGLDALVDTAASPTGRSEWVVISGPGRDKPTVDQPVNVRNVLLQLALAALVVIAVVGLVGSLISKRTAEQQSVHDAAQITDVLASGVVQPVVTDAMVTNPRLAHTVLDRLLRLETTQVAGIVRSKIWQPTPNGGKVIYSDEPQLVGHTFAFDEEAETSLRASRTEASISDLKRPENTYERGQGKLLEVYRPIWTNSGRPLLFETYFRYDTVNARSRDLWRGFSGIMLSSLAAVFLLLLPLLWTLLSRTRRAQMQREQMMKNAVEASQEERKRIAGTLHDGVVQQLVAASYAVAGEAERAAGEGDAGRAARLSDTAGTVRDSVAGMRSLLVDIYPPSLRTGGLSAALHDLARTMAGHDAEISLAIDAGAAADLSIEHQQAVFRIAQECLRNAVKHSRARRIEIVLTPGEAGAVRLEISDDGVGFDQERAQRAVEDGHLGMSLIADAAAQCGGVLSVSSAPGSGTRFRLEVPR